MIPDFKMRLCTAFYAILTVSSCGGTNHFSRFDGWYNNRAHAEWGTPGSAMLHTVPANYEDSVYRAYGTGSGFPNSRIISEAFQASEEGILSVRQQSVLLPFYAQLIVDDIVDTRRVACPAEYMNIYVPNADSPGESIMPVYRSKFSKKTGSSPNSPRKLVNEVTSWLDGSVIYGPSQSWSEHLREYREGRLKSQGNTSSNFPPFNYNGIPLINPTIDTEGHGMPRNPSELLSFGNARGNENVFLMTLSIVWFRYHNFLARRFAQENPTWSDEKVFENARKWTIATYQSIALYEMLPALINNVSIPEYAGRPTSEIIRDTSIFRSRLRTGLWQQLASYNSLLDPAVSVEFSAAAMRIGHSMIPAGVALRRSDCSVMDPLPREFIMSAGEPALRLCNTYWQLQETITKQGIDDIIRGLASQTSEEADHVIIEDLRNFLYGPVKRSRMDLIALTIERGRDAGLASYNAVRISQGLEKIRTFSEFTGVPDRVISRVAEQYRNDTDRLEMYVGGLLESASLENGVGPLFSRIIAEQFARLRDSDRHWFENMDEGFFTEEDIQLIRNMAFRDVIVATTGVRADSLQQNLFFTTGNPCPSVRVVSANFSQPCTPNKGKDLFEGYWGKYSGTVILLALFPILSYIVMRGVARTNLNKQKAERNRLSKKIRKQSTRLFSTGSAEESIGNNMFSGFEIEGKNAIRPVVVTMEGNLLKILNTGGGTLRKLNLNKFNKVYLLLSENKRKDLMVIRVPKEYDVVVKFNSQEERDAARTITGQFLAKSNINVTVFELHERILLSEAVTKEVRQQLLESFFRRVFSQVLNIEPEKPPRKMSILPNFVKRKTPSHIRDCLVDCELTEAEFAEILGMTAGAIFVKQMFKLADSDNSGYLSMREFADLLVILMTGSPEEKAKMLFEMYDVDHDGEVTREEGKTMIKSFMEMASYNSKGLEVDEAIDVIFRQCGLGEKGSLTLEMFTNVLLREHRDAFASAKLALPGMSLPAQERRNAISTGVTSTKPTYRKSQDTVVTRKQRIPINSTATSSKEATGWRKHCQLVKRYVGNYRRHIFCTVIFYAITAALMIERATHYALKSEHTGIRQITEWGLIISRSTAAAISFHYSIILLTMCRNLITFCRETFLNNFIPFDAAVGFHKQIAYVAIVETALHVFGHIVNFYHISVHPLPVLACIFPTILVDDGSDLPKPFVWWLYQSITGITGILLVAVLSIIYIFAMQYSRRFCFRAFWTTHHLFVALFILMILHGSVGLIQSPLFHFYLAGPATIFTLDQLVTLSRSKISTTVVKADPLPSGVLNLVFKRPTGFDYRPGQWVRIACLSLETSEYHPFTLTSAPHEEYLSLHIRAVGPWTTNLRSTYQEAIDQKKAYPKLFLDGPFGEGHQDWYKYEVSVLVGAGIGVTPFASILKDIVQKCKTNTGLKIVCKKVYFVWVTRTQRHFEWLTDIIRDLEESDGDDMVDTHIYITQFHHKFDLRTTILYICERFFQKEANKSLFTGLQAMTHFGRPQFRSFFESLQSIHDDVNRFGVFSCGPPGLTSDVEASSKEINSRGKSQFLHFFENF